MDRTRWQAPAGAAQSRTIDHAGTSQQGSRFPIIISLPQQCSLNILRYIAAVAILGCQFHPAAAAASEFTGIASLTSEYIYRGLAQSDGNPAFQIGLDYDFDAGIFVGAWASTIDLQSAAGERDTELDLYLGYHYESEAPLSATITVLRYTYPGQTGSHSYDHNEVLVSTTWR